MNEENQFRQPQDQTIKPISYQTTEEPMGVTLPEPERELPVKSGWQNVVLVGLGVLLIVGGIALGLRNKSTNDEIVDLPDYSPASVSESPSAEVTPSPEESPAPAESPSPVATPAAPTQSTSIKKVATKTAPKITTAAKSVAPASPSANLPVYQAVVGLADYQPQYSSPTPSAQTISITLMTPGHTYTVEAYQNVTVAALMQAARSQGLNYETKQFSFGSLVTSINGQSEGSGQYWTFTKNGAFSQLGIDAQTVGNGDVITWSLASI